MEQYKKLKKYIKHELRNNAVIFGYSKLESIIILAVGNKLFSSMDELGDFISFYYKHIASNSINLRDEINNEIIQLYDNGILRYNIVSKSLYSSVNKYLYRYNEKSDLFNINYEQNSNIVISNKDMNCFEFIDNLKGAIDFMLEYNGLDIDIDELLNKGVTEIDHLFVFIKNTYANDMDNILEDTNNITFNNFKEILNKHKIDTSNNIKIKSIYFDLIKLSK